MTVPPSSAIRIPQSAFRKNWLFPLFLLLATCIAYMPSWHGDFLWKDDQFILHNSQINFWQGLYRIWFKTSVQYYPLTYTTFWIEYQFWGMNPLGYHLVNIALHAIAAALLWRVLLRLNVPGAWLAASIFALHPVNVESVAWIVERKNTLSAVFYLCSILAALKFWLPELQSIVHSPQSSVLSPESRSIAADWKYYWLAFGLFVCALFSKTTTIPLPAVVLLLVWWKRGKITWRDIYPCFLFVAAGVAVGLITHHVERNLGATGKSFQFSVLDRTLLAARNFWFYLGKLVWPHPLMFVYPRWKIAPPPAVAWLSLLAFVPACGVLWHARKSWGRPAFVAFAYFGGMLFFTLGFFNVFFFIYSFVSDHFQYLACMGPIALFAAAFTLAFSPRSTVGSPESTADNPQSVVAAVQTARNPQWRLIISACLLVFLATLTWNYSRAYTGAETLWRDTIAKNPNAFLAYNNLGSLLYNDGQLDAAIVDYQKSVAIHPDGDIFHNLGNTLLQRGRAAEAYAYFQKALKLQPDSATAHLDLGTYYLQAGRTDLAIQTFQKALQLDPHLAMASYNLGNAYIQNHQLDAAIQYWQKAVELQPGFAMAHNNLGNAYRLKGQIALAVEHWKDACIAQPNLLPAQVNLAWVWATCPDPSLRDGPDALALAERANQLAGGVNPMLLRVLAAALAENGQYSDAIDAAQQALQMARGNPGLAADIQNQLKFYQKNQPFRDRSLAGPIKN